ncbi:MAG TPA: Nif3-like dinuclear metal center hexameric protein [Thermodesulfobacteriota bacterium]|nr:Nif3-like dinuclear metal center hexameric protein [Thermodesulfobacteriota bacterium]
MPKLNKIVAFLDEYLKKDDVKDSAWNGLQFEGRGTVKKVAFAVDAGIDAFRASADLKADILIVHHGHFWDFRNPSVTGWAKERIKILFENDISLYVSHNPLDRHKEVGHNAQILKLLGAGIKDEFFHYHGKNIGWIGECRKALRLKDIEKKLNSELNTACKVLPFGKERVKTIAVCSGGGSYGGFYRALDAGVDLYITGDAVEIYHTAKDAGVNVIFAGHHATETLGLHALSKVLQKKFGLDTVYIDLPTGL